MNGVGSMHHLLRAEMGAASPNKNQISTFMRALPSVQVNKTTKSAAGKKNVIDHPGIWTLAHAISYDAIKYDIAWSKGLYQIDYKLPISVCSDACKEGIGGYIYKKNTRK